MACVVSVWLMAGLSTSGSLVVKAHKINQPPPHTLSRMSASMYHLIGSPVNYKFYNKPTFPHHPVSSRGALK